MVAAKVVKAAVAVRAVDPVGKVALAAVEAKVVKAADLAAKAVKVADRVDSAAADKAALAVDLEADPAVLAAEAIPSKPRRWKKPSRKS